MRAEAAFLTSFHPGPTSRFASTFSATRSTPSARSIRTRSAPTTGCARFASCPPPSFHWNVYAKPADELRGLNLDGLRPEVRAEWARTVEMLESGQTPPSLDLFAAYLVDRPTTLTDYLSADSLVIVDEPSAVELVASQLERQAQRAARCLRRQRRATGWTS